MGLSSLLIPQYLSASTVSIISVLLLTVTASPIPIKSEDISPLNSTAAAAASISASASAAVTTASQNDVNSCALPNSGGIVSIAPNGWALPSNNKCEPGSYCPYACPPGQLMAQWNPSATSYEHPEDMAGGLYCNDDGTLSTPFPQKPLCYEGKGTVSAASYSGPVAFCQTVLPGSEDMLIPNLITGDSGQVLAVPGPEYWCGTSAHYYVNPPGVSVADGCQWGTSAEPRGNWAPYVAGANMDADGTTYAKIGWNPEYLDAFANVQPSFGLRIVSDNGSDGADYDGLPCEIGPGNSLESCVVGAKNGSKLRIEVFDVGSNQSSTSTSSSSSFGNTTTSATAQKDATGTVSPSRSTTIILQKRDAAPSTTMKSSSSSQTATITSAPPTATGSSSAGSDETSTTTRTSTITVTVTLKNVHAASSTATSSKTN